MHRKKKKLTREEKLSLLKRISKVDSRQFTLKEKKEIEKIRKEIKRPKSLPRMYKGHKVY